VVSLLAAVKLSNSSIAKNSSLRTRSDRRPQIHQAFLSLAASVICYRIWNNER
jgi:hypothetical protein